MKIQHCFLVCACLSAILYTVDSLRVEYNNVDWSEVKEKAAWVGKLVSANKDIAKNAPSIIKFLRDVGRSVKPLSINPAFAVSTIYTTGMLAAVYYYSLEAEKQLRDAQLHLQDDIRLIRSKIIPTIEFLDNKLSSGNLGGLCKVEKSFVKRLKETVDSFDKIRGDIYNKMDGAASGSTTNKYLMGAATVGGLVAVGAIATAPCLATAMLACPQAIGGAASLVGSTVGAGGFWYNSHTHGQTLQILDTTRFTVLDAMEKCNNLQSTIELRCIEYASSEDNVDVNNMMKQLEVLRPTTPKLELVDQNANSDGQRQARNDESWDWTTKMHTTIKKLKMKIVDSL